MLKSQLLELIQIIEANKGGDIAGYFCAASKALYELHGHIEYLEQTNQQKEANHADHP